MEKILNNVMFKSEAMQQVLKEIGPYIESAASILLWGETGSGMGFLAQAIHHTSGRSGKFLTIPAFALEKETAKRQFLGSENQPGWLEEADRGTIFIKRLSEMDHDVQTIITQLLSNRSVDGRLQFPRLNSTNEVEVNNRFIFSMVHDLNIALQDELTNRETLDEMKRRGGKIVHIPPLRERKEDILAIAEHLAATSRDAHQSAVSGISESARNALVNYSWPGNIEELKHVIETIIARQPEITTISAEHLPDTIINPEKKGEYMYRFKLKDDAKFLGRMMTTSLKLQTSTKTLRMETVNISEIRRIEDAAFAPPKFKYYLVRLKDGSQVTGAILDKKLGIETSFDPAYEIDPQNIASMYIA